MALWEEKNGILCPHRFGYDAVDDTSKRRRAPRTSSYAEDDELSPYKRRKLVSTTRDLQRNFSIAGWAIRKHLDYVSSFTFQSRTQDPAFDRKLEQLMKWWMKPVNCDIAGRHGFPEIVRLVEQARTVDGDVLVLRLASGHVQAIEGDRIVNGVLANGQKVGNLTYINGVLVDDAGCAQQYALSRRTPGSTSLTFERYIDATNCILVGYFDRFDQVRGISRMAPAVNTFQDLYEGLTYALAKAKVSQLFGLVTYRDSPDQLGNILQGTMQDGVTTRYEIEFGKGPFHLDLDDGDKAEILESKTPAVEFQQFCKEMIGAAIKSLDIPFSFYDESFTNYSGARQALLQYEQSVETKRQSLQTMLDQITTWKISQWVGRNVLALPAGLRITDLTWDWVACGLPWIDPLKEIEADVKAIQAGVRSRQQICKERGGDFFQTADELGVEKQYLEALDLSAEPAPATGGTPAKADSNSSEDQNAVSN